MGRDRDARPGTSSGPGGKARSGQITGDTQLSLLSAQNAGHTGLNWSTQPVFSTSTWYAFAGHVISTDSTSKLLGGREAGHLNHINGNAASHSVHSDTVPT